MGAASRFRLARVATCACLVFAPACSGGGGSSPGNAPAPPPVVTRSFAFPAAIATSAPGGVAWTIARVTTSLSGSPGAPNGNRYDTLTVTVGFAQNVAHALPPPGTSLASGAQLGVGISLDVDGNPATGAYQTCDASNPLTPFEYFSDAGTRLADGNYPIIDAAGQPIYSGPSNPPAEAVTTVGATTVTQAFYLPSIGIAAGASVPHIGIGVEATNGVTSGPTACLPPPPAAELFTTP